MGIEDTRVTLQDGTLAGPYRQPRNVLQSLDGSIHNDSVARPLGFRGGTIGGVIHHEQFAPLMLRAFGRRWFETGGISIYYLNAATDSERVRAFAAQPPPAADDVQIDVWMDHENGMRVLEGTASIGRPAEASHLRRRFESRPEPGEVRILAALPIGEQMPERTVRIDMEHQLTRQPVITETSDWYWTSSPWGGAIATPVTMFRLLNRALVVRDQIPAAVGLYGAIEVNLRRGPLLIDHDYVAQGRLLAAGETPKSEYLWWESTLREPGSDDVVAELLMMHRWMKRSSELWAEEES